MPLLTLDGVACAAPDGSPLFSGLTLSLNQERLGLVGRNGSGKTTLLNAIAGTVPLTTGTIGLSGRTGLLQQLPPGELVTIGDALGVKPQVDHIPSEFIAQVDPAVGAGLLGDKMWNVMFDNSNAHNLADGVFGYAKSLHTSKGIHPGSSVASLKRAYKSQGLKNVGGGSFTLYQGTPGAIGYRETDFGSFHGKIEDIGIQTALNDD